MTEQMKIDQLEEAKEIEAQIALDPEAIDPAWCAVNCYWKNRPWRT